MQHCGVRDVVFRTATGSTKVAADLMGNLALLRATRPNGAGGTMDVVNDREGAGRGKDCKKLKAKNGL